MIGVLLSLLVLLVPLQVHPVLGASTSTFSPVPWNPAAQRLPQPLVPETQNGDLTLSRFRRHFVLGDGNCQFRAMSHLLFDTEDFHKVVRRLAVQEIIEDPVFFGEFLTDGENIVDYVARMSVSSEWGDDLTLQAISRAYNITIRVFTVSDRDGQITQSVRTPRTPARGEEEVSSDYPVHNLMFVNGNHYDALTPVTTSDPRQCVAPVSKMFKEEAGDDDEWCVPSDDEGDEDMMELIDKDVKDSDKVKTSDPLVLQVLETFNNMPFIGRPGMWAVRRCGKRVGPDGRIIGLAWDRERWAEELSKVANRTRLAEWLLSKEHEKLHKWVCDEASRREQVLVDANLAEKRDGEIASDDLVIVIDDDDDFIDDEYGVDIPVPAQGDVADDATTNGRISDKESSVEKLLKHSLRITKTMRLPKSKKCLLNLKTRFEMTTWIELKSSPSPCLALNWTYKPRRKMEATLRSSNLD